MRNLIGQTLGHYRVLSKIGEGGMGEVYRAHDDRLDRDVAVKVLPKSVAEDPERIARFERESKAVAKLSHPHICTLHDVGQEEGVDFLVMEYLDGESLADRLAKGAVPLEEALAIAIQIGSALDAAHRRGILHRDLKPGNIMLTKDGAKLLDFGLAKLSAPDAVVSVSALATEDEPLTAEGTLLGTVQYMAPEQLEGKEADARTDVFSFGALLYETITGNRAFEGESKASLISAIMSSEPRQMSELHKGSPPALDRTVAKCLAKDPEERWQTARDLVDELRWIDSGAATETKEVAKPRGWRLASGVLIGALLATAIMWVVWPETDTTPSPARLHLSLPDGQELAISWNPPFVFSPDGSQLVYNARQPGAPRQFHLRPIDGFEARPLAGTESAEMPFFSPDGRSLGFFSRGKLWKLSLAGGAPAAICDVSQFISGASWGADDSIIFAVVGSGLMRVPAQGGSPEPLTTLREGEEHWWPQFLPDGKAIVFTVDTKNGFRPAIASLETGEHHVLEELGAGRVARYVSSGHIVYAEGGQLLAVPFDPVRLQLTGTATSVLDGLHTSPISGLAFFAVSNTGALAYLRGGQAEEERRLVLVDRQGNGTPLVDERGNFMSPSYSPDGTKVAVERFEGSGRRTIWVFDLMSGARIRLTTEGENGMPIWGPSGDRITFWSDYETIQSKVVGADAADELHRSPHPIFPGSWTLGGENLMFFEFHPETRGDIWFLSGEGEAKPWIVTEFSEGYPELSPDGRWLAYVSNESGRYEVYVQPFPGPGKKITVSTNGGYEPIWSPDGRELFYRIGPRVMAVSFQTSPVFRSGRPRELFDGPYISGASIAAIATTYDVAPDGQHFLMIEGGGEEGENQLHLVLNWLDELKHLVPTD